MDVDRFDALTTMLSAGSARRRVVHVLVAGVLGVGVSRRGAEPAAAAKCRNPLHRCGGKNTCCGRKQGKTVCQKLEESFCGPTHPGRRCCVRDGFPAPNDTCGCCSGFSVGPMGQHVCRRVCAGPEDCRKGQTCCFVGFTGYCAPSC